MSRQQIEATPFDAEKLGFVRLPPIDNQGRSMWQHPTGGIVGHDEVIAATTKVRNGTDEDRTDWFDNVRRRLGRA